MVWLVLLQENALHSGVDVICGTPGRLNDHLNRGNFVRPYKFIYLSPTTVLSNISCIFLIFCLHFGTFPLSPFPSFLSVLPLPLFPTPSFHFCSSPQNLDNVKFLVLDEADELLTPNFKVQIENVLEDCPKDKQMMLFSATLPHDIKSVTKRLEGHLVSHVVRQTKNSLMLQRRTNRPSTWYCSGLI